MPKGVGLYPHKRDNDTNFKDLHSLTSIITSWQPDLVWNLAAQQKGCCTHAMDNSILCNPYLSPCREAAVFPLKFQHLS